LQAEDLFVEAKSSDLDLKEAAEEIAAALERLPVEQREVVELRIYGGLTFREIAEVLAVPQGTVATRYRTALQRLRALFVEK
jgi:RNA polymerase sigma-70 factor (ECF subfamily)